MFISNFDHYDLNNEQSTFDDFENDNFLKEIEDYYSDILKNKRFSNAIQESLEVALMSNLI